MKYYCRQIVPSDQRSPMFVNQYGILRSEDHSINQSLMLMPQRNCHTFMSHFLKSVHDKLEGVLEDIGMIIEGIEKDRLREFWVSEKEAGIRKILADHGGCRMRLNDDGDYVPSGDWTSEEIGRWQENRFVHGQLKGFDEKLAYALTLITGNGWKIRQIHGCAQGDWAECLYDSTVISDEDIRTFECEYFNLGTEWLVPDKAQCDPEDEVPMTRLYCHTSDNEEARKEIADSIGCDIFDVRLGIPRVEIIYDYT